MRTCSKCGSTDFDPVYYRCVRCDQPPDQPQQMLYPETLYPGDIIQLYARDDVVFLVIDKTYAFVWPSASKQEDRKVTVNVDTGKLRIRTNDELQRYRLAETCVPGDALAIDGASEIITDGNICAMRAVYTIMNMETGKLKGLISSAGVRKKLVDKAPAPPKE